MARALWIDAEPGCRALQLFTLQHHSRRAVEARRMVDDVPHRRAIAPGTS